MKIKLNINRYHFTLLMLWGIYLAWALVILGFLMCILGYAMNIVKLTKLDFKEPYKAEVVRVLGIAPPIGIIVGWLDIED